MKGFLFVGVTILALVAAPNPAVQAQSGPPVEGQLRNYEPLEEPVPVPDVAVLTREGGTTTFDRFEGRFVVLNLWATWCGPCIRELPSLARLDDALADKRAQVVLISQDRGGFKQTDRFLKKLGVNIADSFVDERLKFSRAIGISSLPTTIFIGPEGLEVGRLVGTAEWDSPEALALIEWYRDREAGDGGS